jgi:hypothetical protein
MGNCNSSGRWPLASNYYRLLAEYSYWCSSRNQQQAVIPARPRARTNAIVPKQPCFTERYRNTGRGSWQIWNQGAASCPASCLTSSRTPTQTTPFAPATTFRPGASVRITLPIHPFYGRDLLVWEAPRRWYRRQTIGAEFPTGLLKRVPLEWTDRRPSSPTPVVGGQAVLLQAAMLLRAIRWVIEQEEKLTAERSAPGSEHEFESPADLADASAPGADRGGPRRVRPSAARTRATRSSSQVVGADVVATGTTHGRTGRGGGRR